MGNSGSISNLYIRSTHGGEIHITVPFGPISRMLAACIACYVGPYSKVLHYPPCKRRNCLDLSQLGQPGEAVYGTVCEGVRGADRTE